MKLVVLDAYSIDKGDKNCWKEFERIPGVSEIVVYDRTSPSELIERARDTELLLTNKVILDRESMKQLPNLRYIGVLATGYNVVDVKAAKEMGITVTNIPAYSTMSVAQKVFALLFAVTDRVEHYALQNRQGKWSDNPDFCYWDTELTEISGKKIGIVGLGNIGMTVARIALAFGMKVLAYTSKEIEQLPDGIEKVTLDSLFSESDIISLHCPLNEDTKHLVNEKTILRMKPSAILINTGRGPLIDEKALADALKEGRIRAFCGDVLSTEPPSSENPLLSAPNSYVTPHIAWATAEAISRLLSIAASNLSSFLSSRPINVVS